MQADSVGNYSLVGFARVQLTVKTVFHSVVKGCAHSIEISQGDISSKHNRCLKFALSNSNIVYNFLHFF